MKRTTKRLFGIALSILLLLSLLPVNAMAVQTDAEKILTEAYALPQGASLPYEATLTGEIISVETPYDPNWESLTVVMEIHGYENMPIMCYRLSGEGAEELSVGDIITVTGIITNSYGSIEFAQGCTLDEVLPEAVLPDPGLTPAEIVDQAYLLAPGESLPYEACLTGRIVDIPTPYSELYENITVTIVVEGREEKPIDCYRMRGDGAEMLCIGDVITVWGTIRSYARYDREIGKYLDPIVEFALPEFVTGEYPPEKPVELYCKTPNYWSECYIYWWGDSHSVLQWPGTPMEQDAYGIWYAFVPGDADGVLFHNGNGEQSPDQMLPTDDQTMYIFDQREWSEYDTPEDIYYLTGYINGIEYYTEEDFENMNRYRFVDGKLTFKFIQDSYVCLKAAGQYSWFMTANYVGDSDTATFYDTESGDYREKMRIPGGVQVTFTLTENPNGSLTLSYELLGDDRKPDSLALVGEGLPGIDVWRPEDPAGDMTEVSGNVYVKSLQVKAGTYMMFKIVGNDQWDEDWCFGYGSITTDSKVLLERGSSCKNIQLHVDENCTLRFIVDLNGLRTGGNATLLVEKVQPATYRELTVIAPDTWKTVYAYTWQPKVYGSWPGAKMVAAYASTYKTKISDEIVNLVLTGELADGNYRYTPDICLKPNGYDVTVKISDTADVEVYYAGPDEDYPSSLALVGTGLPGIGEWDPADPAGDMNKVSGGVYEKILEIPKGTDMEFRIVGNDWWDDNWNFGGGSITPGAMMELDGRPDSSLLTHSATEDCVLKFTVDLRPIYDGENATLQVHDITPSRADRKLTVFGPATWSSVYIYTWEPEFFGQFPGTVLEKHDTYDTILVPDDMDTMILSGVLPDGTRQQTCDIYLENNGKDVEIAIHENGDYTLRYVVPRTVTYRVVGNTEWMGLWDPASPLGVMEGVAPNTFRKCFKDVAPGSYEFMISKNGTWDEAIGERGGYNFCFNVGRTCDVTVTLTFVDGEPVVKVDYISVCIGDVTGEGNVNLGDVARIYAHIRGKSLLTGEAALINGDFTGDGKINIGDTAGLYAYICGQDQTSIVDTAYRLAVNQELPLNSTVTGTVVSVVEPYDAVRDCITVSITVPGREDYPLLCTRLTGANAKNVAVNDLVTVKGRIRNFYGIVEFKEGCRLVDWEDLPDEAAAMQQLVDAAYALGLNEAMDHPVTLTGTVVSVDMPHTLGVPYISVTIQVSGREDKPIFCYRMLGLLNEWLEVGCVATVTGTLRNYNGTVEFREGCELVDFYVPG